MNRPKLTSLTVRRPPYYRSPCLTLLAVLAACSPGPGEAPVAAVPSSSLPAAVRPRLMPAGVPADYAATPHGFFHASCMAEVKPGETVLADGSIRAASGAVRTVGPCQRDRFSAAGQRVTSVSAASVAALVPTPGPAPGPTSVYNGWIESYNTTSTGALSRLSATWVVPAAPSAPNDGQVIYFFNGLEGLPNTESILQPVLSFAGGQWTATSWNCCKSGTTYHGNTINVRPGDTIVGTVIGTGCDTRTGLL